MQSQVIRPLLFLGIAVFGVMVVWAGVQAQDGVLFVENDRVGMGTAIPETALDVFGTDAGSETRLRIRNSASNTVNRTMLELINDNGGTQFFLTSGSRGTTWQFSNTGSFIVSLVGTSGPELTVRKNGSVRMGPGRNTTFNLSPDGNLEITGALSENSSRTVKRDFATVDGREVLDRVRELPIASWNYKFDDPSIRHLGPVAEDFHGAFALGASERQISSLDTSGVALAAIQGLSELVDEKDARISRLEKANEEMAARLEALEKALASPK